MKILISVADKANEELIQQTTHDAGFDTTANLNEKDAYNTYAQEQLPFVITDSLAICNKIRQHAGSDFCFIIILIKKVDASTIDKIINEGASDYLKAPLKSGDVLSLRLRTATRQFNQHHNLDEILSDLNNTVCSLEQSHEDLQSILNHLRIGSGMTGPYGDLSFLSESAKEIFEITDDSYKNKPWHEAFPFKPSDIVLLRNLVDTPADKRKKLQFHLRTPGGRYYWLDVEAFDDPVMPQRKVFFFYDMSEVYDLRRMLEEKAQFLDLIGKSKPMHRVYEGIQEVAAVDVTVSIEGETGTGKELVAKAIHSSSHRKDKPFIAVNCAGFTDSLLTSQLFGHKRGAFTGAHEDNKGVFEAANGGTLFLDEIGEIPMNVQINLLRVLQEREVTRVGESTTRKVDVRVITATNRDLVKEVEKGTFRADLFFRIRVARVQVPPLRERREDIPLLVGAFIKKNNAASGKQVENVSNKAMNKLLEYDWPGNVRELVNTIEFANLRCKGSTINLQDLPPEITEHFSETQTPAISMTHGLSEKDRFVTALEEASGNRKEAAQLLNMSRATFYRRLSKLGIANK